MAQTYLCDNHPEEPAEAIIMLTQVPTGEVAKLCADCWPHLFAAMLDALPSAEAPPSGAPTTDADAAPPEAARGDGDKVVPLQRGGRPATGSARSKGARKAPA